MPFARTLRDQEPASRRVNRSSDGTVRSVLVASAEGQRTIPVRPGTLSISGDVVTTTQVQPPR